MGLRAKLAGLLSRGESFEVGGDELIAVDIVPLAEGPMKVESLRCAGIEAVMVEAFDAVTARSTAQIMVPHRQRAVAVDVLATLR